MNKRELRLSAHLLREAAEHYGRHGCNDFDLTRHFDKSFLETFVREYHEWNGDPEVFDPRHLYLPDFAIMAFLADKLDKLAEV